MAEFGVCRVRQLCTGLQSYDCEHSCIKEEVFRGQELSILQLSVQLSVPQAKLLTACKKMKMEGEHLKI